MANTINMKKLDKKIVSRVEAFGVARLTLADLRSKKTKAVEAIKAEIDAIKLTRQERIEKGEDRDKVYAETSTVELDKKVTRIKDTFDAQMSPFKSDIESAYNLIPDGLYEAYCEKVRTLGGDKATSEFNNKMKDFFINCGMEDGTEKDTVIAKTAKRICTLFGATTASKKGMAEGDFVAHMTKARFNELFMCAFLQLLIKHKIVGAEEVKEEVKEETKEETNPDSISSMEECIAKLEKNVRNFYMDDENESALKNFAKVHNNDFNKVYDEMKVLVEVLYGLDKEAESEAC